MNRHACMMIIHDQYERWVPKDVLAHILPRLLYNVYVGLHVVDSLIYLQCPKHLSEPIFHAYLIDESMPCMHVDAGFIHHNNTCL